MGEKIANSASDKGLISKKWTKDMDTFQKKAYIQPIAYEKKAQYYH